MFEQWNGARASRSSIDNTPRRRKPKASPALSTQSGQVEIRIGALGAGSSFTHFPSRMMGECLMVARYSLADLTLLHDQLT